MPKEENGSNVDRRKFLQAASATVASSAFAGQAVACSDTELDSELADAREKYTDPQEVQEIVNRRSTLLSTLSSDGLLDRPKVSVDELLSTDEYLDSDEGVRVWGLNYPGAGATTHITIRKQVGNGQLVIAINPDLDNGPRARYKPDTVNAEVLGGEPITRYLSKSQGQTPQKVQKNYTEMRPEEVAEAKKSGSTPSTSSSDDVSTQGTVIGLCRNRGGSGCDTYRCYAWEGECLGDSCDIYDCSGNLCYDGCCTCEEEDWCCEVCGDYGCDSDPCDSVSYPC